MVNHRHLQHAAKKKKKSTGPLSSDQVLDSQQKKKKREGGGEGGGRGQEEDLFHPHGEVLSEPAERDKSHAERSSPRGTSSTEGQDLAGGCMIRRSSSSSLAEAPSSTLVANEESTSRKEKSGTDASPGKKTGQGSKLSVETPDSVHSRSHTEKRREEKKEEDVTREEDKNKNEKDKKEDDGVDAEGTRNTGEGGPRRTTTNASQEEEAKVRSKEDGSSLPHDDSSEEGDKKKDGARHPGEQGTVGGGCEEESDGDSRRRRQGGEKKEEQEARESLNASPTSPVPEGQEEEVGLSKKTVGRAEEDKGERGDLGNGDQPARQPGKASFSSSEGLDPSSSSSCSAHPPLVSSSPSLSTAVSGVDSSGETQRLAQASPSPDEATEEEEEEEDAPEDNPDGPEEDGVTFTPFAALLATQWSEEKLDEHLGESPGGLVSRGDQDHQNEVYVHPDKKKARRFFSRGGGTEEREEEGEGKNEGDEEDEERRNLFETCGELLQDGGPLVTVRRVNTPQELAHAAKRLNEVSIARALRRIKPDESLINRYVASHLEGVLAMDIQNVRGRTHLRGIHM